MLVRVMSSVVLVAAVLAVASRPLSAQTVTQQGDAWTIENNQLKVTVTASPGGINVADKVSGRIWKQAEAADHPFTELRTTRAGSVSFVTQFGDFKGKSRLVNISLALPPDGADLQVTALPATTSPEKTDLQDPFLFLKPFILETPDAVLAVADYCDGHIYPLHLDPFPSSWFEGGRLDMPFVGVCDLKVGYGYCEILETSDDAFIQCRRFDVQGSKVYAPHLGWRPSKGTFRYARKLLIRFVPKGGYVAIAKAYRDYATRAGLVVPFSVKLKRNPNIQRLFGAPDVWGDTRLAFAKEAKAAGVEKMLIHGRTTPDEMKQINALGYLTSEYDNYTDILPLEAGRQPDSSHDLIPEAAVMLPNGERMKAWLTYDKKIQYMKRCPALWAPAAKIVIDTLLKTHPYLGRFIDVTTAEGLYECFDPLHPLTNSDKREAGQVLLEVDRSHGLVVGGEHGIWWGAARQDYIEGMMSGNRFPWPAGHLMHPKNRQEKFDGSSDWNSWDVYDRWSLGHEWRVPLWELVFHDCVVSTWYWGDSNDYLMDAAPETIEKKDAFNILYGTMPMLWADGGGAWNKDRSVFLRTIRNVCRFQEKVAASEMISHEFLTPDHAVQRTRFANGAECTVNFGKENFEFTHAGHKYLLPQNGWLAVGSGFEQSRQVEVSRFGSGKAVTTIRMPGYAAGEVNGSVGTLTATGQDQVRLNTTKPQGVVVADPRLGDKQWDFATTRTYLLDSQGVRIKHMSVKKHGNNLGFDLGGGTSLDILCRAAAKHPDLEIDSADISVLPSAIVKQGAPSSLIVKVHNVGGANASSFRLRLYADREKEGALLGTKTGTAIAGGTCKISFKLDTSLFDGAHRLILVADTGAKELCDRNNRAEAALTVAPDFSRWLHIRRFRLDSGSINRVGQTVAIPLPTGADPRSARIVQCDTAGKPVQLLPAQLGAAEGKPGIVFSVPGIVKMAYGSMALLYNSTSSQKYWPTGASGWDTSTARYRGVTYMAHFENGTLRDIEQVGKPVISHLMFSSAATGWTEEPGDVVEFKVMEDGPVRTCVFVRKKLLSGVETHKTFTFYPDRFEIGGDAIGGFGVFSRAYYVRGGQYLDSGGYKALVDGSGDGEGVSNLAQNPAWYSVTGDGWFHTCVSLSKSSDITYWDNSAAWGGIGFNTSPMSGIRYLYQFHVGKPDLQFAEQDAANATKPVNVEWIK